MLLLSFICINVINKVHSLTEFAWEISCLKNKPKAISSGCAKTKKNLKIGGSALESGGAGGC